MSSPETGAPGVDGKVEVVDVPAATVLSIGARGSDDRARVDELRQVLERWLERWCREPATHGDYLERVGIKRLLSLYEY